MAQTKPKAGQFYGVSNNGTDGEFLQTDGTGGMAWASPITNPTITSIDYPGTQTAADPAGGESVIINGTLFASGITCTVGGTSAVTAFNSATQITITTPAKAAGPYTVVVTNTNGGTASENNFIQYSGVPVWSTAAGTLGNVLEGEAASFQVTATEGSDTIEYAVTTGTLPTGLSLATATGAITGTAGSVSADTTTTFSITATDDENQTSSERSFSITVTNDNPSNYFNTVLYTGNNSAQSITGVGFQSDLIWFKDRGGTYSHSLYNSISGRDRFLRSNSTNSESTGASATQDLVSFDTNGFTLGTDYHTVNNASGRNYVAWCFKAGGAAVSNTDGTITSQVSVNNTLGFSIVKYTGSSPNQTVGHGLDATPEFIVVKNMDTSGNGWATQSPFSGGADYHMMLNLTQAAQNNVDWIWNDVNPTSTVFSIGQNGITNTSGDNYISYCFTSKPGFSKVGSYTGNGSASGPIVQTGFEPAFLMIKTTGVDGWFMVDNKRETSNPRGDRLFANDAGAEASEPGAQVNFYANGFQLTGSGGGQGQTNSNGQTYIYLAIAADGSTATPSLANSFATEIYTGNGGTQAITTGFKPDLVWIKSRSSASWSNFLQDSVRGVANFLISNSTGAQGTTSPNIVGSFDTNGFSVLGNGNSNNNNDTYVSWNWKAGDTASINTDGTITSIVSANQAAGFSVVSYTANATSGATIGHNLGGEPDMVIVKSTNLTQSWNTYIKDVTDTNAKYLMLNSSSAISNTANPRFIPGNFSSTVFSVGNDNSTNGISGTDKYIAYCFKSISGYSKVGSYTGGGNTNPTINVGFTPTWLMVKRVTGGTGGWTIVDNKRHPGTPSYVNGNVLYANESLAEQDDNNIRGFNITSTGFTPNGNYATTNNNGDTYIYLAIKEN